MQVLKHRIKPKFDHYVIDRLARIEFDFSAQLIAGGEHRRLATRRIKEINRGYVYR